MYPTISEIRKIAQNRPDRHDFYMWSVVRKISAYVTWLLVRTPITPNQITALSIALGLAGSLFFLNADPFIWVLGWLVIQGNLILDQSDGEVARFRKKETKYGHFLDELNHPMVNTFFFIMLTIGVFNLTGEAIYLIFGGLAVFSVTSYRMAGLFQDYFQHRMLMGAGNKREQPKGILRKLASIPGGLGGYFHLSVAPALLDVMFSQEWASALIPLQLPSFRSVYIVMIGVLFPIILLKRIVSMKSILK